jgi:hypothetical protein
MMKIMLILLLLSLTLLTACFVRTGPAYRTRGQQSRACPPAHHWDGYACVHNGNGNGNGHGKHKGRD